MEWLHHHNLRTLLHLTECESHHTSNTVRPYSRKFLTATCATIDMFYTPGSPSSHVEFIVTIDISKRVLLHVEYIRLDVGNCEEDLSVYETADLLEADLIERLCSKILRHDHQISADWNTMGITNGYYLKEGYVQPMSVFIATYRGVELTMERNVRKYGNTGYRLATNAITNID